MRHTLPAVSTGIGLLLLLSGCGPAPTSAPPGGTTSPGATTTNPGTTAGGTTNPGAGGVTKISGQGSTFVKPIMDKWVEAYTKDHKDVEINYQGTGSGAGIKAMIDKANDFGCTDAFMKNEDLEKAQAAGGEVIHAPLVLGAIVPAYNLPKVDKPLNFDCDTLAGIFMG